mmetsp:Transcript_10140/g.28775  ORF Transcript_10140/g.28775 Transcript_10140/m.28775 type:complete len:151 (+) Transcript_10140:117-569(+)
MVAIEVPAQYGWVVLGAGIGTLFTGFNLSGAVMKARTQYNVQYPNLYAVPGYHKNADEFNRVQRGHQNYLEGLGSYVTLALIGGLKYPIANAIGSVCFCVGSVLYMKGYSDTSLDVTTARYKKGGIIKWVGVLISLVSTGSFAYGLITSA